MLNRLRGRIAGLLVAAFALLLPDVPRTPVTIKFNEHPFAKRIYAKAISGGHGTGSILVAICRAICEGVTAVFNAPLRAAGMSTQLALEGGWLVAFKGEMAKKHDQWTKLVKELEAGQKEMEAGPLSQARGDELEAKAKEAEGLQAELERYERTESMARKGREIPDPTLPVPAGVKTGSARQVTHYIGLGDYITTAKGMQELRGTGWKGSFPVEIPFAIGRLMRTKRRGENGEPLIPLMESEAKQLIEHISTLEQKANVSLGTGVLDAQRLPVVPQVTHDDTLTLRDVIAQGTTDAASVEYVRDEGMTRAAAEVAHGGAKPETTMSYTLQTATVRTIAAWQKVQTQQLDDMPMLRSLIDNRLLYDLGMREEEEIMYGDGIAPNITGLITVSGTTDIASLTRYAATDDQILDVIRMGVTEVRRAGYQPNALLIDPLDWEEVELLKATDKNYIWAVIRDQLGPRVWGLRVVETVAAEQQKVIATQKRSLVVGDFQRGAMIVDRMNAQVLVGLNNDDFTKNLRTILAEERIAFPIFAPKAFAKFTTKAEAT